MKTGPLDSTVRRTALFFPLGPPRAPEGLKDTFPGEPRLPCDTQRSLRLLCPLTPFPPNTILQPQC